MININEVYVAVQQIMSKAQQGYLNPSSFNTFANLANQQLFTYYYGSTNSYIPNKPMARVAYASNQKIAESLEPFIVYNTPLTLTSGFALVPEDKVHVIQMSNTYTSGSVTKTVDVRRVEFDRFNSWKNDPIESPDNEFPIYAENATDFIFYPASLGTVETTYLRMPVTVSWNYNVVSGRPVYDSGTSADFEWNPDERSNLINKILSLAGMSVQDMNTVQYAESQEKEQWQ